MIFSEKLYNKALDKPSHAYFVMCNGGFFMFDFAILDLLKNLFCFAGYIGGNTAFPKPLTEKEEQHYITLYKKGDENARSILIERNLRLVAHISKKFQTSNIDSDDLISIGTIGLIKGVNTFDFNKSKSLASYIARCIENEILMYIRSNKKVKSEISLSDPIGTDKEGNNISLIDIICTDEYAVDDKVSLRIQVEKLYSDVERLLSPREKKVIILRYGLYGKKRLTQRETAKILDISRSYVSRIEKKAISKLALEFTKNE